MPSLFSNVQQPSPISLFGQCSGQKSEPSLFNVRRPSQISFFGRVSEQKSEMPSLFGKVTQPKSAIAPDSSSDLLSCGNHDWVEKYIADKIIQSLNGFPKPQESSINELDEYIKSKCPREKIVEFFEKTGNKIISFLSMFFRPERFCFT